MNTGISIVIALIVVFFFVDGIRRGLLRAIFEIIGIIAAFIAAYHYGHYIAASLAGSLKISHAALLYFFSFIVFVAIIVVFHILGILLQKIASATVLGPVDRLGGALFGALKGVLVVSLILVILAWLPLPDGFKRQVHENPVAAHIHPVLPRMYHLLIKRVPEKAKEAVDEIEKPREIPRETRQPRTA